MPGAAPTDRGKTGHRDRRLDERPVRGPAAAGARLCGRHLRAGRERIVRPRRRHRRPAECAPGHARARHRHRRSRRRDDDAEDPRCRGPHRGRAGLPADADGLGAALSHPARRLPGAALSPRRGTEGLRAERRRGARASGRRRAASKPTCWSAPTASARPCASSSCPTSIRSMPAMSPGARSSPSRPSRPRSIASCSSP